MPVTISYPGVYLEELNGLSLSVSTSATAVPVFAVSDSNLYFTKTTRISSWMDYLNKKVLLPADSPGDFDSSDVLDLSMRTYYENGGGYCYLVPVNSLNEEVPKLNDVTLLVAAGEDITSAISMLCGQGKCLFAIVDGPTQELVLGAGSGVIEPVNEQHAAVYYPWLIAKWALTPIPPSAAMAGVYASVDLTRGVWKAPANITLKGGVLPEYPVTDELQGEFTKNNPLNMIRMFGNGATTVWGARTRLDDAAWRYVSVRRLFNSAERDIKAAMKSAVYEPNNQPTWELARGAITNYLYRLWRQGGLVGSTAQEAFFVRVGKDVTMTQEDIDEGRMIVKVGMAAVRPAEFIILQFTQDMAS